MSTDSQSSPEPSRKSIWSQARSLIYDNSIVNFTSRWYQSVLELIPENSHILDVGIGTGAALINSSSILRARNITVVGVDYDEAYVQTCRENIASAGVSNMVSVVQADIRDFSPPDERLYDHIYFSGSFMIIPDQVNVLKKVVDLLVDRQDGRIYFTQTFELQKNSLLEWLKPRLSMITTIDFGQVSYQQDFEDAIAAAGVAVESSEVIDDGKTKPNVRESRLICCRSKLYVESVAETAT
ncbi:Carboxy-S-adenosyl-L-methionine synthase [Gracilariopsis chorda]|uniref:Carboxy-S-adenosyl-L-methionine synthase n=1 Tax=Gracilariopsis chorda TaxID=448386 RepID=A0A2V3IGA9_9FLOR|nr:Carboxy-S-adenosyl-L-methionine synthase [Gracilariopsis chorda]|eukprot:PXF41136.1 Carboxy-S-adenosyl-L-methionine synthase [Gracilariopsis chorda]